MNNIETTNRVILDNNVSQLESMLNDFVAGVEYQRQAVLDRYNVNLLDVEIIRYLNNNQMKKMKEIGEHFGIKLSTLTSIIDKLEKVKLARRKHSKEDRRVIYLQPTSKGIRLLSELEQVTRGLAELLNQALGSSEMQTFSSGMAHMLERLRAN